MQVKRKKWIKSSKQSKKIKVSSQDLVKRPAVKTTANAWLHFDMKTILMEFIIQCKNEWS